MLIAQLTDLHLRPPGLPAYRVSETNMMTARAIDKLRKLTPRPDVVVITGDMTDCGLPEEYALLRSLIADLPMPVYMVPGNHDRRDHLKRAFADWPTIVADPDFVQFVVDDHAVRLIGLDTVVEKSSHGALCTRRLAFLSDALAAAPNRPTIVFMHHPPFDCGIRHMDAIRLLDGSDELAAILKRHPQVLALWCGHNHRQVETMFGGVPTNISPGVAHQVAFHLDDDRDGSLVFEPPAFRLHRYAGGALVSHTVYVEDYAGPFPFVLDPSYPGR
ncbi:MAG: phosphodiesterase [Proteobacteria bacterium]|nr:phosphodiesterase [Pseudomonadota bacterium]